MRTNTLKLDRGDDLYRVAENYLVAGTGAPPRIYPLIGRPLYLQRADGAYLFDLDGNKYIDFHNSAGAALLGHNHPAIKAAILRAVESGFYCNYESEHHTALARHICEMVPSAELVRFATGGSEASFGAIRLARGVTGRSRYLKFEGHYHGQHDYAFFNSDSQLGKVLPNGEIEPTHESAGVPQELDALVTVLPFNQPEIFRDAMRRHRGELAAIIMEPVMYNAGCILPDRDFVQLVRDEATKDGIVLIFDEVLSGFRMCPGGGQEYLGITPDLSCLSKAVGGSVPMAAIVGRREVMRGMLPIGKTNVSGTYTGHLLSVMGAVAALEQLRQPDFYPQLNARAERLYDGINEIFQRRKIKAVCQGLGARFGIFFGIDSLPITDFRKAAGQFDAEMDKKFISKAFARGLYFRDPGRRIVPGHHGISSAHTAEDIDETLNRLDDIFVAF